MVGFRLYLITDRRQVRSSSLSAALLAAIEGGVRAIQLREKDLPVREYLELAMEVRSLTLRHGVRLFINDRVDVALVVGADGVHLGQAGMPPEAVRKIIPSEMLIGVSTHSLREAREAERGGADFITFGPLFSTPSKVKYGPPVGLDALKEVTREVNIPVFGIGGIKKENIMEVMASGAEGIALISGILAADDIKKESEEYVRMSHDDY